MSRVPSPETRARYVAGAIAEMLRGNPDLSWQDVVAINDGPGWDYDLPWYERSPPLQPAEPEPVHGDRLEHLALVRAWHLGRDQAYQSASRSARQ